MKKASLMFALLLPAAVAHAEGGGMPSRSFLVELRFGGGLPIAIGSLGAGAGLVGTATPIASVTVGYRFIDRLHVGVGFSFFRFAQDTPGTTVANNIFY